MINYLHALCHQPGKGWDPVPEKHAKIYAEEQYKNSDYSVVDELEERMGGLTNRRVLDLGGGPGQYSIEFAKRGAKVVWHDISRTYLEIAKMKAKNLNLNIEFSLGYLEDVKNFFQKPFDLVFNRICWQYSIDDQKFAKIFYSLVALGGIGYIDIHYHSETGWQYLLNKWFYFKVGHPCPPRGRIRKLLEKKSVNMLDVDESSGVNEKILFTRS